MRKIVLSFLLLYMFYPNVYAQEGRLERDSLPVFVIQDREFASIVDEFIAEVQKLDSLPPAVFYMEIFLYDYQFSDKIDFILGLREQVESSDSLILYKNPHCHQAFIMHGDILFRASVASYAYSFNYHILTEMLKVLPEKQSIYFKDPPPDYFDLRRIGGDPLRETIYDSFHQYDGVKWTYGGIVLFEDDEQCIFNTIESP